MEYLGAPARITLWKRDDSADDDETHEAALQKLEEQSLEYLVCRADAEAKEAGDEAELGEELLKRAQRLYPGVHCSVAMERMSRERSHEFNDLYGRVRSAANTRRPVLGRLAKRLSDLLVDEAAALSEAEGDDARSEVCKSTGVSEWLIGCASTIEMAARHTKNPERVLEVFKVQRDALRESLPAVRSEAKRSECTAPEAFEKVSKSFTEAGARLSLARDGGEYE